MSLFNADTAVLLEFKRDLLCWRGRDFDERYECRVAGTHGKGVRIEFESVGVDFSEEVAADIAFCLSEALAISEQTEAQSATAAFRDEGILKRKYRLSCGAWQFSAVGAVHVENADSELLEGISAAGVIVGVRTIEEGGFELELGNMGYSFSSQDASWLQETLLKVSRQLPKQYPRVGLLEAAEAAVAGV
ncbi:hypothetical protein ACTACD_13335 [Pseudomonas syringae]|uniref:hypothetical protein n=1 Tax=Pseudomonas syringae TaxID=317 RepID=UPI003F76F746